tara:strand:+ start:1604 stop:2038 length:435 start_codon:yes stop_codon:yes gene_type:complete
VNLDIRILLAGAVILSSCASLNFSKQDSNDIANYDGTSFIVSNFDENLDETYQVCVTKVQEIIESGNIASKGVGGTVLVSGAVAIGTGLAGAVSAVPIAVGLVVVGASTMRTGEVYKQYKGEIEVQNCLEESGYEIVVLKSKDE